MSGVWVFRNGVARLISNPLVESLETVEPITKKRVLVYIPTDEIITSYALLSQKLRFHGWERYHDDPELLQFHKENSAYLITLPKDFNRFKSIHMYDIVVKNKNFFEVREI